MVNYFEQRIFERQRLNSIYKEIFRKSIHICSSFVPLFLRLAFVPTILLLILALFFYSISEVLRMHNKPIPFISKITEVAARKRDENKFVLGPVTLVLGILMAAVILPWRASTVGIFALAFGDGTASLIGKLIGKVPIPGAGGKTVAGSLACFVAVFVATFCFTNLCLLSLILALLAMLIEVLPIRDLDNVFIPISIGSFYLVLMQVI